MKGLIVVDIQNDFLPGGALAVTDGDHIIPIVNRLMKYFNMVVATQDWHPADHGSFASNHSSKNPGDQIVLHGLEQVLWPDHCIQGSVGADFSRDLDTGRFQKIFRKGTDVHIDSYSGFFDNGKKRDTGLNGYLLENAVDEVYVVGLATDYCVKFTALDAVNLGYKAHVLSDATKAVNLKEGDYRRALDELKQRGVVILSAVDLLE